jgi:DNA polymerase theta
VVEQGDQVLVFCTSKQATIASAQLVSAHLKASCSDAVKTGRADLLGSLRKTITGLDPVLGAMVKEGVAYHNAGLTTQERELVEGGYRSGVLCVLTATSTLAAGVNLPARRVILRSMRMGNRNLSVAEYKQMAGRAGRAGHDAQGESILLAAPAQKRAALRLMSGQMPELASCLAEGRRGMTRALLEAVAGGIVTRRADVGPFARCTLFAAQRPAEEVDSCARNALTFLLQSQCVEEVEVAAVGGVGVGGVGGRVVGSGRGSAGIAAAAVTGTARAGPVGPVRPVGPGLLQATKLGRAVFSSGLSPEEGCIVFEELQRAQREFVVHHPLHLVYLVPGTGWQPVAHVLFQANSDSNF